MVQTFQIDLNNKEREWKRTQRIDKIRNRQFICWDGEGAKLGGEGKPQNYILFGNCLGDYITGRDLTFKQIIDLIIKTEEANPDSWHVSFAFTYDVNQIVKHLSRPQHIRLHSTGELAYGSYYISWQRGKVFQVTKRYKDGRKTTATIYDIFSFFASSFVKAVKQYLGSTPELEVVEAGKEKRMAFSSMSELDDLILPYWKTEITLMHKLVDALRERLYEADLFITKWHGPGALASYAMKKHGIKHHMQKTPPAVNRAAQHAYAGGRFELYKAGRYQGPIYSLDINSAYPHVISNLPSLQGAEWEHISHPTSMDLSYTGLFRVKWPRLHLFAKEVAPGFYRDKFDRIFYPPQVDGWYWTSEARDIFRTGQRYDVTPIFEEAYILSTDIDEMPFRWVRDVYQRRANWKKLGIPAQLSLKLLLNSMYGKMAQRIGWNEDTKEPPNWHQLEYAGLVTSEVRSRVWNALMQFNWRDIIAVETDGIYVTQNPRELDFNIGDGLGQWEIGEYEEVVYLQNGFYFLRDKNGNLTSKYRGLDPGSVDYDSIRNLLRSISDPRDRWPSIIGTTTRFITLGAANPIYANYREKFCTWEEMKDREIEIGVGKRVHIPENCEACHMDRGPWDSLHDLCIGIHQPTDSGISKPHPLPWESSCMREAMAADDAQLSLAET